MAYIARLQRSQNGRSKKHWLERPQSHGQPPATPEVYAAGSLIT